MAASHDEPAGSRIALWFGEGLDNALAARAVLGELQAAHPNADWLLLGPQGSFFLFEMDARVQACIPLLGLQARRPSQTRLSYFLNVRAQYRQIRALKLGVCMGVSVAGGSSSSTAAQFKEFKKAVKLPGLLIEKTLPEFLQADRPMLQAGPQALAFATQLHRTSPPHLPKWLVLLSSDSGGIDAIKAQWVSIQGKLQQQPSVYLTVAVLGSGNPRLLARWLGAHHPDWLQIDLPQAMGLLAYADRVVSSSKAIALVCAEMGRSDQLLLVKTHS